MIKSSMTLFLTSFPPFGSETLCVEQIYKQNGKQCAGVIAKQWYGNRRTLLFTTLSTGRILATQCLFLLIWV